MGGPSAQVAVHDSQDSTSICSTDDAHGKAIFISKRTSTEDRNGYREGKDTNYILIGSGAQFKDSQETAFARQALPVER